jgi:quercetin dioxygenase-like cupin family protein
MGAALTRWQGRGPSQDEIERRLRDEGLDPHGWGNAPGEVYGRHTHGYHKVLYCVRGNITFHTDDGDLELRPGDRLDIEPGTEHGATVGPEGVECVEAPRPRRR